MWTFPYTKKAVEAASAFVDASRLWERLQFKPRSGVLTNSEGKVVGGYFQSSYVTKDYTEEPAREPIGIIHTCEGVPDVVVYDGKIEVYGEQLWAAENRASEDFLFSEIGFRGRYGSVGA